MTETLNKYRVHLRRRGSKIRGRIDVEATTTTSAERLAKDQLIAVSYPNSKRSEWIVASVEERV